jgi:hypothetical protein
MTDTRLEAFSVIARSFFCDEAICFGHRCNYNGLLAILDTTDVMKELTMKIASCERGDIIAPEPPVKERSKTFQEQLLPFPNGRREG